MPGTELDEIALVQRYLRLVLRRSLKRVRHVPGFVQNPIGFLSLTTEAANGQRETTYQSGSGTRCSPLFIR